MWLPENRVVDAKRSLLRPQNIQSRGIPYHWQKAAPRFWPSLRCGDLGIGLVTLPILSYLNNFLSNAPALCIRLWSGSERIKRFVASRVLRGESMRFDTVIRNGTVVTATDTYAGDIGIAGDKITAIAQSLPVENAGKVIDAAGPSRSPRRHRRAHASRHALWRHHQRGRFRNRHDRRGVSAAPPRWSISPFSTKARRCARRSIPG